MVRWLVTILATCAMSSGVTLGGQLPPQQPAPKTRRNEGSIERTPRKRPSPQTRMGITP